MFTAYIQALDLFYWKEFNLFLFFFITTWTIHLIKINKSKNYESNYINKALHTTLAPIYPSVSIVIPVVDEDPKIWKDVLELLNVAIQGLKAEVIVVANGKQSDNNAEVASKFGFNVIRIPDASKRLAILEASKHIKNDVTVILDSDTLVEAASIKELIKPFDASEVGGATPRQYIFKSNNIWRRISDWLEDIRFSEVLSGQSIKGAVSCLPGRLLAIRTDLLLRYVEDLANQKFLGAKCISGDDRYLTSRILRDGFKTIYVPMSVVYTDAPTTLKKFVLQRLRWSRTSLRETILSLPWIFKYPYTAFTVLAYTVMRWFFFVVIMTFIVKLMFNDIDSHYLNLSSEWMVLGTLGGFLSSGFLRQLRHLKNKPSDIKLLIPFLFITTFILTPVEWYGNLTLRESGWMTRKTK